MLKPDKPDIAHEVPFVHLCELFERMSTSKRAKDRKANLHKFVDQYARLTRNYYPVMRLMVPEADLQRVYGIKEKVLALIVLDAYGISKSSDDGKRLLQWREGEGKLPAIVYSLALARSTAKSRWTLQEVNVFLDSLAKAKGLKDKKKIFAQVVSKLHAREVKWLCKIILKKLRYGASLPTVLNAFYNKASDLYAFQANLEHVCNVLKDPNFILEDSLELKIGVPFQPMLSSRRKPLDIPKTMDPPYFVETKYDGERVLIHLQKRKTTIFSRYLQNSTALYVPIICQLRAALKLGSRATKSCILDAELLVWDEEKECIEPFGSARAIAASGSKDKHFFLKIFDVLHHNENTLIDHTLDERKRVLHSIIKDIPTRIETVKHIECATILEVEKLFRRATSAKEEGIVVKNPRSPYIPNVRNNKAWVKLKPDFVSNIASDLDVLILGGYYGEGEKAGGKLYTYLVGVKNNDGSEYYPVGKVATGLTEQERTMLLEELEEDWVSECPVNVLPGGDVPDMWISPEDSRVLQVRAMQIIPCEKRAAGVTFRCPRIDKIRYDKSPEDIITLERLRTLILEAPEMKESGMKSKVKSRKKERKPLTLPTDVSALEVTSDLFKGNVFYVCGNAWKKEKREDIETSIHRFGGTFHQNYGPRVTIVLASLATAQLQTLIKESKMRQQRQKEDKDYLHLRVLDLKDLLRQRHLKLSGRKAELIERLEEYDAKLQPIHVVKVEWLRQSIEQKQCIDFTGEYMW
uniref:DNA ligase n=1 Tax=Pithovirus LCPAC304 TaxID=2506594 RepID=A0A481Z7N9_9VIRU|nr:MAG: ATP-dependent DNA ligase [Pithovirus LCPAC304]